MDPEALQKTAPSRTVVIQNLQPPGSFSVTNNGPEIALLRSVLVERQAADGQWESTDADVRLIASCDEAEDGEVRVLKAGETLVVKSWDGWSCDGQCPRPCRANIYLGPGEFRFVVFSADRASRFEGASFHLGESRR